MKTEFLAINEKWAWRSVRITHKNGLHMRPLEMFIKKTTTFDSDIELIKGDQRANGKSIISVLALGVSQGTTLLLHARGRDAEEAVRELSILIESDFKIAGKGLKKASRGVPGPRKKEI